MLTAREQPLLAVTRESPPAARKTQRNQEKKKSHQPAPLKWVQVVYAVYMRLIKPPKILFPARENDCSSQGRQQHALAGMQSSRNAHTLPAHRRWKPRMGS